MRRPQVRVYMGDSDDLRWPYEEPPKVGDLIIDEVQVNPNSKAAKPRMKARRRVVTSVFYRLDLDQLVVWTREYRMEEDILDALSEE